MSASFGTEFDECYVENGVMTCTDILNGQFTSVVLGHCSDTLHFCALLSSPGESRSNTLSCSGAMLSSALRDVNPLSEDPVDAQGLRVTESDFFYRYIYQADVRTVFAHDVAALTCSNMQTCVSFFADVEDVCFGMDQVAHSPLWTFVVTSAIWFAVLMLMHLVRADKLRTSLRMSAAVGTPFFIILIIGVTTLVPPFAMLVGVFVAACVHGFMFTDTSPYHLR